MILSICVSLCALDKDDWAIVARNAVRLPKPGGIIQWEEAEYLSGGCALKALKGRVDSTVSSINQIAKWFYDVFGQRVHYGWSTLLHIFPRVGVLETWTEIVSSDREPNTREQISRYIV